jgi:hypothetical protein
MEDMQHSSYRRPQMLVSLWEDKSVSLKTVFSLNLLK